MKTNHKTNRIKINTSISGFLAGLFLTVLLSSCGSWFGEEEDTSPVVVTYKDKNLTLRELSFYIPDGLSIEDSARQAESYISEWIEQQAIAEAALKQIPDLEDDINFKVEDYRRQQLVHAFETDLISRKLDTTVTVRELQNYYKQVKENFLSKEELYSYFYVVTPEYYESRILREWMRSDDPALLDSVRKWVEVPENADFYKLDSSFLGNYEITQARKGYYGDLKDKNPGDLIRWTGNIQGQRKRYFFKMLKKVEVGEPLPLSEIRERLIARILVERKNKIIDAEEDRIMAEAKRKVVRKF